LTGSQFLGRLVLLAAITVIFSGRRGKAADPGHGHDGGILNDRRSQTQRLAAQPAIGLVAKHDVNRARFDGQPT